MWEDVEVNIYNFWWGKNSKKINDHFGENKRASCWLGLCMKA